LIPSNIGGATAVNGISEFILDVLCLDEKYLKVVFRLSQSHKCLKVVFRISQSHKSLKKISSDTNLLYILKRKQIFVVVVAAEHTTLLIFNTIIYTIRKNIIVRYSPKISDFLLHGIKIAIRLATRNKL
jgi:hypothetical protein